MYSQYTHTKKIITQYISILKLISMRWVQEIPLVAQNPYLASINTLINSRSQSSCLFSDSWINNVWVPRLPSNPLYEENNQEQLLDYFCFFLSLLSKEVNKNSLLFSLRKEKKKSKNSLQLLLEKKWQKP